MFSVEGGCPTPEQYAKNLTDPLFLRMREFSRGFLERNAKHLDDYGKRWSLDPLEHWSRRWEYPYAAHAIEAYLAERPGSVRIFDAGSGLTFFPGYIAAQRPDVEYICFDIDSSYTETFSKLEGPGQERSQLVIGDLAAIPLAAHSIDVCLCISVLEHMPDPAVVVAEFERITKPGGLICLTFDIDLSPDAGGVDVEAATHILESLSQIATPMADYPKLLREVVDRPVPVSSKWVKYFERGNKLKLWSATTFDRKKLDTITFLCATYRKG